MDRTLIDRLLSKPLYSTDGKKTKEVLVTFKHCLSDWTWHIVEASREDNDIIMFGYVVSGLGPDCSEWGYVSLNELAEIPFIVPFIQNDTKIDMSGHVYK